MQRSRRPDSDDLQLLVHRLWTGRYQTWRPADGVPIRSTVGAPRFWRHPTRLVHCREITPYGVFGTGLDDLDAHSAYVRRLDERAADVIGALARIAVDHPGEKLVILCFDPVGAECHRHWFSDWAADRWGLAVPEVEHELPVAQQLPGLGVGD